MTTWLGIHTPGSRQDGVLLTYPCQQLHEHSFPFVSHFLIQMLSCLRPSELPIPKQGLLTQALT